MKLKVLSLLCLAFIWISNGIQATALGLGDIAITGYNADAPDEFSFVLLKDISGTTIISFTDGGWLAAGGFRPGEGTIKLTVTGTQNCGTAFLISNASGSWTSNIGSVATVGGTFEISSSGDQIFAYNGTIVPTADDQLGFITGLHFAGAIYDSDATGNVESAQPPIFANNPGNDFAVAHMDNGKYGCSLTSGLPGDLRSSIYTAGNWSFTNISTARFNLSQFCSFACTSACTFAVLTTPTSNSSIGNNTFCPGDQVIITVNGTPNDATEWRLYDGSCGGPLVQSVAAVNGAQFILTATTTKTYFIGGVGGCIATPPNCSGIKITVNGVTADAGPDQKLNGASFTTLQANGGFGDGTWTFSNNGEKDGDGQGSFSDDENPSAIFSGTAGQAYTLRWTLNNSAAGCPDTEDEVTIVFLDQTGLTLGDIAFTSYSADNDNISFILLKDITAGTSIKFTDRGWLAAGGFRGGESTMTVEFCRPYNCGDEFDIFDALQEIKDASGVIAGTVSGEINPATSGDQVFAYQGPEINLITGIQMNGPWDADATSAETSAKPAAFTDGVNSISFPTEFDNAYLDCSKVTTASASQIYTTSNWILSDNVSANLPLNCNLSCCTPGVATSINGYVGPPLCPSSTQTLSVNGSLNDDQEWVWYTGSCGGTEVNRRSSSFNVSPTATTTYYVRAEGTCSGTSGTCVSFQVEIEDKVDPEVTCPANITVNNDPGECSAVVNFSASGTDNCGGTVAISYTQDPGTVFDVGTTTVDVTATDETGNTDNCSFTITVNDNEDPGVTFCPGNIDVNAEPGKCGATITWQTPTFDDNCAIVLVPTTHNSGDFFPVTPFSPTIVTYTAFDASFKSITCSFSVIVRDFELPVFSDCPGNISVDNDTGDCGAIVNWTPPTLSDNCTGASSSSTHDPGRFFDVGTTTVTYSGEDRAFNPAVDCSFTVTVNDTEAPSAQCSATTVTLNPSGTVGITAADVDNGSTDNCLIASQSVSPNSFDTGDTAAPNPVILTVVDNYGNVDTCHTNVTVEKRTSVLTNLGVSSGQYSDQVKLQAELKDINGTPLANQDIIFEITGELPTVTTKTNASGIATAYIVVTQAPTILGSNYQVKTSYAGNSLYKESEDMDPFTILQEDALITYTGTYFVSTANVNSSIATVTLAATIQDIADGFRGDIRNAKVTFYDRTNGGNTVISPALPVQLISAGDLTVGNVVYDWENVDIGNADSEVFEIGIVVSHYYTRNSVADNEMITVSKPISQNFITGGGYVRLNNSAGLVAGDDGSKSNFGFNVKFNKKGTKLQGKFQALIRRTEFDGVHTYRIKSNKLTSLSVDPNSGTATLSGRANIQDVTDPNNPISVSGNNIFTVTMVDNGEPGTSDAIGITLYNGGGGLWYSSNWSGTQTVDQLIAGGNIVVHSGGNANLQSIETLPASNSSVQEDLDINIYPNPTTGIMHINLTPLRGKDLEVMVFNTLNQRVWQQSIFEATSDPLQVDLQGLDSGLYIVTILESNGERHSHRIVLSGL